MLKPQGKMLLSGFYINEVDIIEKVAVNYNLKKLYDKEDKNWSLLVLEKKS
jgi:hypothetical protein